MGIFRTNVVITHPCLPDPGINTWHVRLDTASPTESDMADMAGVLSEFYLAMQDACLADGGSWKYDGVLTEVTEDPASYDTGNPWVVGNPGSSATLPPANCIVVGWKTAVASRHGKGRSFMGPIKASVNDATGTPSTACLTAVRAAVAELAASVAGPPAGAWGVYSRAQNIIRDITGGKVADEFAVLRSRRD